MYHYDLTLTDNTNDLLYEFYYFHPDWTSSKPLLMALLQRLLHEMALPFSNQIIMAVLKHGCSMVKNQDMWLNFLKKNHLNNVNLLFRMLIFWSRNIWKRNKLSEENCEHIRDTILDIIKEDEEGKNKLLKVCSQNLVGIGKKGCPKYVLTY